MNRHKIAMFGTMLSLIALCFSDTAHGQTLSITPSNTLPFSVPSGGASQSQAITVSAMLNGSPVVTTVVVSLTNTPTWLSVNGAFSGGSFIANTPATFNVTVNTAGLSAGTYGGSFTITVSGKPSSQQTVTVNLTVGTPSALTANPSTLMFTATQGAQIGNPTSQSVQIQSSGGSLQYGVTTSTTNGQWLLVSATTGITGSTGFQVSVNPSNLAVGNYTGTITVQSATTTDSVTIQVSLQVTAGATLNVTPTSLSAFVYQIGGTVPPAQTLMISTSSGSLNYSVTTSNSASWLVPSPSSGTAGTTPQNITLSINPSGLQIGTYTTSVIITANPGGSLPAIPVTLVVSNNSLLQISNNALTFSAPFSNTTVQTQSVNFTSTGNPVPFTISSDSNWLTAFPSSGTTPTTVTVQVSSSALAVGSYTGTLTARPSNGDSYSLTITVSLTVTAATSQIIAGPDQLVFAYELNKSVPSAQLVQLSNAGQQVAFTLSTSTNTASNCPSTNWLQAVPNSNTAPAQVTVSVVTAGMMAGSCSGAVTVSYNNGTGNTTVVIPVTVNISATALLSVSVLPGFGFATVTAGSTQTITQSISLTSTDPVTTQVCFQASSSSVGPFTWLFLGSSAGQTPQSLQVQVSPAGLPPGTYNGQIQITSSASAGCAAGLPNAVILPFTLVVNPNTTVTITPTGPLTFTEAQGAAAPPTQTLTLTSTGGTATFTASINPGSGGNWLQVSPNSGSASGQITVSINQEVAKQLSIGTYTSQISLAFQGASTPTTTIQVSLVITAAQTVSVAPTSLSFNYQVGGSNPAAQTLNVTSTSGPVSITVGTTSSGWLTVTPATGTSLTGLPTPQVLTVSVNPAGLTAASSPYTGTISVSAPGVLTNPIQVTVTLNITGAPLPQPLTITSNASNVSGVIAPGELIQIKGTGLGPVSPANGTLFTVTSANTVSSTLAGVQVLFDGIPGTPIYVSATQINVTVPYEIAGRPTTNVVVSYQNTQSAPIPQRVADVAPGIYTLNSTGQGQAAVANQNGTFNGPSGGNTTPAPQGSVIAVYMTGGGQTNPPSTTGSVSSATQLLKLPGTVTATINGVTAQVQFAGAAPGLVTGVIQVNVQVPVGVSGNALPIVVFMNGVSSPQGPTIAVQ